MSSALLNMLRPRILFSGVLAVLFVTGCSKRADDCPAPENDGTPVTTRAFEAVDDQETIKSDRPEGFTLRGVETDDQDMDGDGINDDGDDEADGEGNKKGRIQH